MCKLNPVTVAISTDVPKWCSSQTNGNSVVPKFPIVWTGNRLKTFVKASANNTSGIGIPTPHLDDEVTLKPETDDEAE